MDIFKQILPSSKQTPLVITQKYHYLKHFGNLVGEAGGGSICVMANHNPLGVTKHVISARTATSSVHAQSRDQCMINHVNSACSNNNLHVSAALRVPGVFHVVFLHPHSLKAPYDFRQGN